MSSFVIVDMATAAKKLVFAIVNDLYTRAQFLKLSLVSSNA